MVRQKDSTKTTRQKPEVKKANRVSGKTAKKTTPLKHSPSNDKKPTSKNTPTEKKSHVKSTIKKPRTKMVMAKKTLEKKSAKRSAIPQNKEFKEKLSSLTASIDMLLESLPNTDVTTLQNLFKTVFGDINFFVKSFPKIIKDAELLTVYNKAHKKIECLLKYVTCDFEDNNIVLSNACHDENNILLQKIQVNDTIYYRLNYKNEKTLMGIFYENGKTFYHCEKKPDGSKRYHIGGGVIEEIDYYDYDEDKYEPIKSINVDMNMYGSFLGGKPDSITSRFFPVTKPLDLGVVNLLFENHDLKNTLSKLKDNKIFDIKIKVNISNAILQDKKEYLEHGVQSNVSELSMKNNNQAALMSGLNKPILNNSFITGRKILLAAVYGAGKNLLTIEIARLGIDKGFIKYPCFFNFEDKHNKQLQRYTDVFKDKYHIVDFETWNNILKSKEENINNENTLIAFQSAGRKFDKFDNIKNRRNKNSGISTDKNYKIDTFIELMKSKIALGCDFFVLDSLNEIFSNINMYNKNLYDRLLNLTVKDNLTFIILHHLDKKSSDIQGSARIKNQFDSIYFIHEVHNFSNSKNGKVLKIKVEKNTFDSDDKSFYLERTKKSEFVAEYKILGENEALIYDTKGKKLTECIKSFLLVYGEEEISRIELSEHFKDVKNMTTMTNAFTELQREKFIRKKDGKTWKDIIILKPN